MSAYSERDQYLTLATNLHWIYETEYINFSSWEGFGILWEWANKQDWWLKWWIGFYKCYTPLPSASIPQFLINPDEFANILYEFLRTRDLKK